MPQNGSSSLEEIEGALWFALMCQCVHCRRVLFLDEFEHLTDSPMEWAKAAAPYVKACGWSVPNEWELLCDECTDSQRASIITPRFREDIDQPSRTRHSQTVARV